MHAPAYINVPLHIIVILHYTYSVFYDHFYVSLNSANYACMFLYWFAWFWFRFMINLLWSIYFKANFLYLGFGYYHLCPTINQDLKKTSSRSIEKQVVPVLAIRVVVREVVLVVGMPIHLPIEGTLVFRVFSIFSVVMICWNLRDDMCFWWILLALRRIIMCKEGNIDLVAAVSVRIMLMLLVQLAVYNVVCIDSWFLCISCEYKW